MKIYLIEILWLALILFFVGAIVIAILLLICKDSEVQYRFMTREMGQVSQQLKEIELELIRQEIVREEYLKHLEKARRY